MFQRRLAVVDRYAKTYAAKRHAYCGASHTGTDESLNAWTIALGPIYGVKKFKKERRTAQYTPGYMLGPATRGLER